MPRFAFRKLVRDKIVEQQQLASGGRPLYRTLRPDEHAQALIEKILEEAREISQAAPGELAAELADVQQALDDLRDRYGLTAAEVAAAQAAKAAKAGGFSLGLYVEHVEVDADDSWVAYYRANADRYPEI
jgi:predicted house-cleaning noncanonical NTP pyrophosphatase (MazG superfamily)